MTTATVDLPVTIAILPPVARFNLRVRSADLAAASKAFGVHAARADRAGRPCRRPVRMGPRPRRMAAPRPRGRRVRHRRRLRRDPRRGPAQPRRHLRPRDRHRRRRRPRRGTPHRRLPDRPAPPRPRRRQTHDLRHRADRAPARRARPVPHRGLALLREPCRGPAPHRERRAGERLLKPPHPGGDSEAPMERERLQDYTGNGEPVTPTFTAPEMRRRLDAIRAHMAASGHRRRALHLLPLHQLLLRLPLLPVRPPLRPARRPRHLHLDQRRHRRRPALAAHLRRQERHLHRLAQGQLLPRHPRPDRRRQTPRHRVRPHHHRHAGPSQSRIPRDGIRRHRRAFDAPPDDQIRRGDRAISKR